MIHKIGIHGESEHEIFMFLSAEQLAVIEDLQIALNKQYECCVSVTISIGDEEWPFHGVPKERV